MAEMVQFDFVNRQIVLVTAGGATRPVPKMITVATTAAPPQLTKN
ncbi:MAG: hypothetical protein ACXV8R_16900 [Acidimicrobiia bacterium]